MLHRSAFVGRGMRNRASSIAVDSLTFTAAVGHHVRSRGEGKPRSAQAGVQRGALGRLKMTTVSAILAGKGREVVSIEPNASLASAVALLAEKRIGAVLILGADHRITGILSERDIVRALAERGSAALGEPVSTTMTRKVSTCSENETVASIMERMTEGKFRHFPVVDQGRAIGIVSIGDVVKHRLQQMESDSAAMHDYILTA
jgi:CBS domain-containing protein